MIRIKIRNRINFSLKLKVFSFKTTRTTQSLETVSRIMICPMMWQSKAISQSMMIAKMNYHLKLFNRIILNNKTNMTIKTKEGLTNSQLIKPLLKLIKRLNLLQDNQSLFHLVEVKTPKQFLPSVVTKIKMIMSIIRLPGQFKRSKNKT